MHPDSRGQSRNRFFCSRPRQSGALPKAERGNCSRPAPSRARLSDRTAISQLRDRDYKPPLDTARRQSSDIVLNDPACAYLDGFCLLDRLLLVDAPDFIAAGRGAKRAA